MENYFQMNMDKRQIDAISNLGLAHTGDAVFELLCRSYLCCSGVGTYCNACTFVWNLFVHRNVHSA